MDLLIESEEEPIYARLERLTIEWLIAANEWDSKRFTCVQDWVKSLSILKFIYPM